MKQWFLRHWTSGSQEKLKRISQPQSKEKEREGEPELKSAAVKGEQSGYSSQSRDRKESAAQREVSGDLQSPFRDSAQCLSEHTCEETTWKDYRKQ